MSLNNLISALHIFSKYTDSENATYCDYHSFIVFTEKNVSQEDKIKLEELGFLSRKPNCFYSDHIGGWYLNDRN